MSELDQMQEAELVDFIIEGRRILNSSAGSRKTRPNLRKLSRSLIVLHSELREKTMKLRRTHPLAEFVLTEVDDVDSSITELNEEVVHPLQRHYALALVDHLGAFVHLLNSSHEVVNRRTILAYGRTILELSSHVQFVLDIQEDEAVLRCRAINLEMSNLEDQRSDFEIERKRLRRLQGKARTKQVEQEILECSDELKANKRVIEHLRESALRAGMELIAEERDGNRKTRFHPNSLVRDSKSPRDCLEIFDDGGKLAFRHLSGSAHGRERPKSEFALGLSGWADKQTVEQMAFIEIGDVLLALFEATFTIYQRANLEMTELAPIIESIKRVMKEGADPDDFRRRYKEFVELRQSLGD